MIILDSSVWIDHLRSGDSEVAGLLDEAQVLMHPFVLGEIACGHMENRKNLLTLLGNLPTIKIAMDAEILILIEQRGLMGRGLGYIDIHLLASTLLDPGARIWTRDKALLRAAEHLDIVYSPGT